MVPAENSSSSSIRFLYITMAALILILAGISYWGFQQTQALSADVTQQAYQIYQWMLVSVIASSVVTFAIIVIWVKKIFAEQEARFSEQMNYDKLTGLANRSLFWDRLHFSIANAQRNQQLVAVACINIDRFNHINTGLGQDIADQLLKELSSRLRAHTRASDTVARIGGDDFAAILGEVKSREEIEMVVKRLKTLLTETYELADQEININLSIGIAIYPADQSSVEKLFHSANSAMAEAKKSKAGEYVFYTSDMGTESASRLKIEQGLKKALENNEFVLYYQPKVDSSQGAIRGLEALIRWQHPERGLVPPNDFIPILEDSGLIIPVGDWVIKETCEAIKRWKEQGLPIVPVSVNVSAPQFNQDNFVDKVQSKLEESGVAAEFLEIELTESCLMDDAEKNVLILQNLKKLGLQISVDDFGTGYSSLNHLNQFPIDTLKIDRSFITNVNNRKENDNAGIVTAIMALSHSLRLNVVAEGVETAQELAFLYALGCRTIQGFLFSRPLTEADVISLLQNSQSLNEVLLTVREELAAAKG